MAHTIKSVWLAILAALVAVTAGTPNARRVEDQLATVVSQRGGRTTPAAPNGPDALEGPNVRPSSGGRSGSDASPASLGAPGSRSATRDGHGVPTTATSTGTGSSTTSITSITSTIGVGPIRVPTIPVPIPPGRIGNCPIGTPHHVDDPAQLGGPGLFVVGRDGGGLTRLIDGEFVRPDWTPDGLDITSASSPAPPKASAPVQYRLCVHSAAGVPVREIAEGYVGGGGPAGAPGVWSDDQLHYIFNREDTSGPTFRPEVVIIDALGLTSSVPVFRGVFDWTPDGRLVISDDRGVPAIYLLDPASGAFQRLHEIEGIAYEGLVVSPRGDEVAYIDNWNYLDVVKLDGTGYRRLRTAVGGQLTGFSWGPDGKSLVFGGSDGTTFGLQIVDRGTGAVHRITEGIIEHPQWSPDGSSIAGVLENYDSSGAYTGESLIVMDRDGGHRKVLASIPPGQWFALASMWAPDSHRLVFSVATLGGA